MLESLKELCRLNGTSGREEAVREYILKQIGSNAECSVDNLGNIIVFKKGNQPAKKKVMLAAHMDEVGFIVNYITDDGFLKFSCVGGIDKRVVFGRSVLINRDVHGVIAAKPIHLLDSDEKDKIPSIDKMYIDIGAKDKADALKKVSLGDVAFFDSDVRALGKNKLKGKAIDDRAGCAIMLDMIKGEIPFDTYFVFTVQEEVGLRGARVAAYSLDPDYAVVIETTTAADVAGVSGEKRVCSLGGGAVVSYMDRSTIYDKTLYDFAFAVAEKNSIKCQTKSMVAGGNDAGAIHITRGGIKTITVSVPCRYLHSPSCVIDVDDFYSVSSLVRILAESMADDKIG